MPQRYTVPFIPVLRGIKADSEQVAEQLNHLIAHMEAQGWDYCHVETVSAVRPSGCWSFSNKEPSVSVVQIVVFERAEALQLEKRA